MKKLLCILVIALVLLCALISCESTEGTDSTKETEGTVATSVLDGKEEDTPGKVPSEGALSDMEIISTGTIEDCYPVLDCGRYYGADFKNVSDKSYFRIIETHKELSELTEKGALFPKSLFDNSIILALYRKEGCEDVGRIGYSNFKLVNGKASICLDAWDADYMLVDAMEWTEIVYLQIPADIVSGTKIIGGPISISRQETKVFDTVQINADITAIESGRASLVAADQLYAYLGSLGIADVPEWKKGSAYSGNDYIILVACIETDVGKTYGYGNLAVNGDTVYIERIVNGNDIGKSERLIELVAIPSSSLDLENESYTTLSIDRREYAVAQLRTENKITQTVIVEEPSHQYFNFLDLGIYFYDSQLPSGMAYHLITSKAELEQYVEKPYLLESFFENSYVLVLRLNGYIPRNNFGLRDINFQSEGVMRATLDLGRNSYYSFDKDGYSPNAFQGNYCYLSVPKSQLYYDKRTHSSCGTVSLETTTYKSRGQYYYNDYRPVEGYKVKENSLWLIIDGADAVEFRQETGVDLWNAVEKGKFLLVYYGDTGLSTQFSAFRSQQNNIYIDMSYIYREQGYDMRFFAVSISFEEINCSSNSLTAHIFKYTQTQATVEQSPEILSPTLDSFYAAYYEGQSLIKTPDFTFRVIEDKEGYESLLSEYTSFGAYPRVDFEKYSVLAYYVREGCTGCPGATAFGNVRVANGRMYIDKYTGEHIGGDAENPVIYFIAIEKRYFWEPIENIYLIDKEQASFPLDSEVTGKIESEYLTHIISTPGGLKERPDFSYKILTRKEELNEIYSQYTAFGEYGVFSGLDFESMCILAIYCEEGSSLWVHGGFKNMIVENNVIYITKYFPQYKDLGDMEIIGDCMMHPTLHLIAVEKSFEPEKITDVIVFKEKD